MVIYVLSDFTPLIVFKMAWELKFLSSNSKSSFIVSYLQPVAHEIHFHCVFLYYDLDFLSIFA